MKRTIEIGVISVKLPAGLNALPSGFKKEFAAQCKQLNTSFANTLKNYAVTNATISGGGGRTGGRKKKVSA